MGNLDLGVDIDNCARDADPRRVVLRAAVWIGRLCDVVRASREGDGAGEPSGTVC